MIGEPGIGKSRLLWEFIHSAHTSDWLVVESAATSSDSAAASYPVVLDLLRGCFQLNDRDDLSRVRQKLSDRLLILEIPQELLPPLLALFDLSMAETYWTSLDPAQRRQKTLDAVKA